MRPVKKIFSLYILETFDNVLNYVSLSNDKSS